MRSRASILIIALWTICFLTVFAVSLGYTVRQKMTLAKRIDELSQLRLIAESGVSAGIAMIKAAAVENENSAVPEKWRDNPALCKDIEIGEGSYNIWYNYTDPHKAASEIKYGLCDEARKLNVNKADMAVLARFFLLMLDDQMQAQELAAAIVDWRDNDSMLSLPLGSAEDSYYRNLRDPYECKDSDFEALDELLLVKGVTQEIYEKISPYVTIYGNGRINVNTASYPVLLALGLPENIVDKIIMFRAGKDGVDFTADDVLFATPQDITAQLSQANNLTSGEVAVLANISNEYLATRSSYFLIHTSARLKYGRRSFEVSCVVNDKAKIIYWQES